MEPNISALLKPKFSTFWKECLPELTPPESSLLELHFGQALEKLASLPSIAQVDRETQLIISSIENGTFFADPEIFKNSFVQRFRKHFSFNKTDPIYCGVYYPIIDFTELVPSNQPKDFVPFFSTSFKSKAQLIPDLSSDPIRSLLSSSKVLGDSLRLCAFPSVFHPPLSSLALAHFLFFLLRDLNSIDHFEEEIRKHLLVREKGSFNKIDLLEAVGLRRFLSLNEDFAAKFKVLVNICSPDAQEGKRKLFSLKFL